MEIWILLAAAGSGYLAHYYDDDEHSGLSSGTLSSRRRYCQPSSSRRRLKAKSNQNWRVSKLGDSVGKMTVGCATHLYDPIGDDAERVEAQASQNGVILGACSCSEIPTHSQTGLDAVGSYPTNTKNSINGPPKCPSLHTFNAFCALNCCGFDFFDQNHKGHGLMSAEAFSDSWHSTHFTGDSATDVSGSMLRDEFPVKLIYDVLDNDMASKEEGFPYGGTWMPGLLNAFEDTSILETSASFILQEHAGRSSINTRKVRSHQKNGKSRCFTRKSRTLESRLPITSSESCSSIQFDHTCSQEERDDNIHFSSACEQPFFSTKGNEIVEAIVFDGLLSKENRGLRASPRNEILKVLNKIRKSERLVGEKGAKSAYLPCLPSQSNRRGHVNASRECSASPRGDSFLLQGIDC